MRASEWHGKATKNRRAAGLLLLVAALAPIAPGCGPKAGVILYHLGGKDLIDREPAEFKLPNRPLLILVDDDMDLIHPPTARDALVDALATELKRLQLVEKVTTNEELAALRAAEPDFDRRGAREIGQLAQADIVLWLKVTRFTLPDNLDAAMIPAYFGTSVKVLDARADKREDVCLWPPQREGKTVEATVSPHDLQACREMRDAHKVMADALARELIKLFSEHEAEEPKR